MQIEKKLIKFNEDALPENFVAAATYINSEKEAYHAGILIRLENVNYLCHYPGFRTPPTIEKGFNEENVIAYKILDSFDNDEGDVGAFLAQCYRVCKETKITYGYVIDGSSYNDDGLFESKVGLPEIGTCVGFCINILANSMVDVADSFFNLDDWDDSEVIEDVDNFGMREALSKYPTLDWNLYDAFKKRIKPIEYISSSFLNEFPITKESINVIQPYVEAIIAKKFA